MRSRASELARCIASYRRNGRYDPSLLTKILNQKEEFGIDYVLSKVSKEARRFHDMAREVTSEAHRAQSFLRFNVIGDAIITKTSFEHEIADLVLDHFAKRFPKKTVVIIESDNAHVAEGGDRKICESGPYLKMLEKSPAEKRDSEGDIWSSFYDSQFIESRRNKKLAQKCIPKKLWKKYDIKEGVKIQYGISKIKLSDFI